MKKSLFILVLIAAMALIGCKTTYYQGMAVTDNPIGTKIGEAPLSPTGIQEAAQKAGITKIATVDIRYSSDGDVYVVSGE
jgi:hypothetical protein